MILIFQASNSYIAYTAAYIYYNELILTEVLPREPNICRQEAVIFGYSSWNWRKKPLFVLGSVDSQVICCMVYGHYEWLYQRVLTNFAQLFNVEMLHVDIGTQLPWYNIPLNIKLKIILVRYWPQIFEQIYRGQIYHFMQKYSIMNRQGDAG